MEEEAREKEKGMTFESFTDIHRDDTPLQKLALLVDTSEMLANDRVNRMEAYYRGNNADSEYYARECGHMKKREPWVFEELAKDLKRLEEYDASSISKEEKQDILNCVAYVLQKT